MEAKQAALAKLSLRIAAHVESQINAYQTLCNKKFNQIPSFTSKHPLIGSTIEITEKVGTYFATARLDTATPLPRYEVRIDELTKELNDS